MEGKVAIVTGSSSGLGEAIALMFLSRGARVTICGRDQDRLLSVKEKSMKASGDHADRFITVRGDVTDHNVRKEIVDKTIEAFGKLDILVVNAGMIPPPDQPCRYNEETFDTVMNVNVKSSLFIIQEAVPHLKETKGNIVIMSSVSSTLVVNFSMGYSIGKAALDHMSDCLAVDLGQSGIRVNTVNPSLISTRISRELENADAIMDASLQKFEAAQALHCKPGRITAEDVAEAVTFLASDAARYITGVHLKVDAGRSFGAASSSTEL